MTASASGMPVVIALATAGSACCGKVNTTDCWFWLGTKDGKHVIVSVEEFIRRFLLHVLPDGFVKIRHYGLLASGNVHTKLAEARRLLQPTGESDTAPTPEQTWMERLTALTGVDLTICPRCGGPMIRRPLVDDPLQVARATSSSPPAFADSS